MSIVENLLANMNEAKRRAHGAKPAATAAPTRAAAVPVSRVEPSKHIHIDFRALRQQGYVPEEGQERRFADYCREVKRPLIRKALASDAAPERRLIMVSSALPGDGKTFVTLNLAFSMARERDVSVLLVDADLPKAHISRVLEVRNEPGLLDALADEKCDVGSLIIGTDVSGLALLPAGRPHDLAAELITSERMAQIASALLASDPRRLVLFDSPPLLISSEARALMQFPGLVLLVARSGHTPHQALQEALGHIRKESLHGLVINETTVPVSSHYGYYGYGSGPGEDAPRGPDGRDDQRDR